MNPVIESAYQYTPVWIQNVGISLYGFYWKWQRLGGQFVNYVKEFEKRDRCSVDEMNDFVDARLRTLIHHAYKNVPWYRSEWKEHGICDGDLADISAANLHTLPVTRKAGLRESPDSFVAENIRHNEKLYRYASSGSTGTPVTAICTADEHRRFIAAREARSWRWAGSSILRSRSMIGGRMVVPKGVGRPPFHRYNRAEKQVYFSAFHIAPQNVQEYVRAFNYYRPRLLTGYAYSHYLLAKMMHEQGLTLDYEPDALVLTSEKLTEEMKRVMRKAFRARAYEEYGAVENCVLATECENGKLHVSPDYGVVEIIGEDGRPAKPGEEGRIVCTGLLNDAQPLIRYEIGDLGVWSFEKCGCGRDHLPILQEITGRIEDVVRGPDGREMVRFHGIFIDLENVVEGQIIQERLDRFTVKVVAGPAFGTGEEAVIRRRFVERLGPVEVTIRKVPAIPRTERGKFRAVISLVSRPGGSNIDAEEAATAKRNGVNDYTSR